MDRRAIANRVEDAVHAFAYVNELPIDQLSINPDRGNSLCFDMRLRTDMPEPYNREIDATADRALQKFGPKLWINRC